MSCPIQLPKGKDDTGAYEVIEKQRIVLEPIPSLDHIHLGVTVVILNHIPQEPGRTPTSCWRWISALCYNSLYRWANPFHFIVESRQQPYTLEVQVPCARGSFLAPDCNNALINLHLVSCHCPRSSQDVPLSHCNAAWHIILRSNRRLLSLEPARFDELRCLSLRSAARFRFLTSWITPLLPTILRSIECSQASTLYTPNCPR